MRIALRLPQPAAWTLYGAAASALMLAAAHAFERFGGLAPCELCLKQREVYWIALLVGMAGYVLAGWMRRPRLTVIVCALLALLFLVGATVAAYHAGVEWKFWPGPKSCTGGGKINLSDMAGLLNGARISLPQCDVAKWRLLGISMAGYNALISLALAAVSAAVTWKWRAFDGR